MKVYSGISELGAAPLNCVATIGNFDGAHLGHRQIFSLLIAKAKDLGGTATVITFKPHPQVALRPEKHLELLNTYSEKLEFLEKIGIRVVIEEPFSREFSNTSAEEFVKNYLLKKLQIRALFLGHDFAFGKERSGSAELVRKLAEASGVEVLEVPAFQWRGENASSTRIRRALDAGDMPLVNELLDRRFFLRGVVVKGLGRGHKINVPTANLSLEWRKLPRQGVYATRAKWRDQNFAAVTNVGVNPTFTHGVEKPPVVVETHILDYAGELYGHSLDVEFIEYIRAEKKFSGAEELVAQIQKDIAAAKKIHAKAVS